MKLPHWLGCRWGKWEKRQCSRIVFKTGLKYEFTVQVRVCEVCNKTEAEELL